MGGFAVARKLFSKPKVQQVIRQPEPKPAPVVVQDIDPKDPAYSKAKRRGRRSTILTSATGASDELELARKTLLGG
tara:strand:+ start:214 stop:441 length:228 start_codon:yes stop_codon:yes gene_type:complete